MSRFTQSVVLIFTFLAAFHAVIGNPDDPNVVGAVVVVLLFLAAAVTLGLEHGKRKE